MIETVTKVIGVLPHSRVKAVLALKPLFSLDLEMTMLGLPLLVSVTPDPLPSSLCAYSTRSFITEKSIFITSPFERKKEKKAEIVWVENEVAEVQVILSNPMAFPIPIESMSLRCASDSLQCTLNIICSLCINSIMRRIIILPTVVITIDIICAYSLSLQHYGHPVRGVQCGTGDSAAHREDVCAALRQAPR